MDKVEELLARQATADVLRADWVKLTNTANAYADRGEYAEAAVLAVRAYEDFAAGAPDKQRTIGILVVAAASFYYKARQYGLLKEFVAKVKSERSLSDFAQAQLEELLTWAAAPDAV